MPATLIESRHINDTRSRPAPVQQHVAETLLPQRSRGGFFWDDTLSGATGFIVPPMPDATWYLVSASPGATGFIVPPMPDATWGLTPSTIKTAWERLRILELSPAETSYWTASFTTPTPKETLRKLLHTSHQEQDTPRGTYTLAVKHRVLFTQEVEFHISKLPRRPPRVYVNQATLEDNDDV